MKITRERFLTLALLCTLIAVGIHSYLAKQHYALKFGSAAGGSLCNVSSTFSCDAVAASDFSVLFGIPVAVWGAVANLMLAFFLLGTRLKWTDEPESTGRYSLWLAGLIALASVGMGLISLTQMSTYCLFCMACYVLSFLTFFFTWKGSDGFRHFAEDFAALFKARVWVLVCALLIPGLSYLVNASTVKSSGMADIQRYLGEFVAQWKAAPQRQFQEDKGLILQSGNGPTTLTLVEFADFRCPHCRHASPTLHAFTQANPGVKLIFKFFPLDGTCNPSPRLGGQGDGISCHLAFMTHCAQKMAQRGWEAHHFFFDHQDQILGMSSKKMVSDLYCKEDPKNCEAVVACSEKQETVDEVRAMAQEGIDAEVPGTPAVFGNGRVMRNGQMMPVLDAIYKASR